MANIQLNIDGREYTAGNGLTIFEVCKKEGIHIPHLCHHKDLPDTSACRLCLVEVEGMRTLTASCSQQVSDKMVVRTNTERVQNARKLVIEFLLSDHPYDCMTCEKSGACKLEQYAYEFGIRKSRFEGEQHHYPLDNSNPFIVRDYNKCILCERCTRACDEIQNIKAIDYMHRGFNTKVSVPYDRGLMESDCVFCGQCVQVCPVGALTEKKATGMARTWELKKVRTTCPYCGVGCQLNLHMKGEQIVKVTGVDGGAPNKGRLCVKGRFGYDFIYSSERLTTPLIKENGEFRVASWDEALGLVASKFKEIIEKHGTDSVAGISCARSINEDSYNMQKLFRSVFKTNNIDHCARCCHAPTVAGLWTTFGTGGMTNTLDEFSRAKLLFCIGTNMTEAHPVASTFVKNAARKGGKLIVVDPRRHKLADFADIFAQIKVGSDVAFVNGLMNVLITENLYDKEFVKNNCENFEDLKKKVLEYTPEKAAKISGVTADEIRKIAHTMAEIRPAMVIYTLGITEHTCGTNNVMSLANLQMLLGNIGMELGGVNPLRGQNNVQGACDMGALPNTYPGYQRVDDPAVKAKFEKAWGVENLSDKPGIMIPQMLEGLQSKKIRMLYIFGENIVNTEPDIRHVEHCLESAEFLVCQDIFPTETTRFADVILPAAAWSEDEGTFVNCERRVSLVRSVKTPPGIAKPNWWIFREIAKRLGHKWKSASGREIWDNELSVVAPAFAGIKYNRIQEDGIQWPCPTSDHSGTPILHRDGKFTHGKGLLQALDWTPPNEIPDKDYPFVLSTGRRLYHYHTRTQTGRSKGLNNLLSEETADISMEDAKRLGIEDGEMISVKSRRGEVKVKAKVTDRVPRGMVWMAFHFRDGNANWLTNQAYDSVTMTAEYKACAVNISKI